VPNCLNFSKNSEKQVLYTGCKVFPFFFKIG
jgi:hypothetical protein